MLYIIITLRSRELLKMHCCAHCYVAPPPSFYTANDRRRGCVLRYSTYYLLTTIATVMFVLLFSIIFYFQQKKSENYNSFFSIMTKTLNRQAVLYKSFYEVCVISKNKLLHYVLHREYIFNQKLHSLHRFKLQVILT